jgi:hypothetical protein
MPLALKVALVAVVALSFASAGAAKGVPLPRIDLQKLCRASQIGGLGGRTDSGQGSVSSCVADEQDARNQLIKSWSSYPASARAECIKPGVYLPSYVEWLTCIQMTADARKLQADQPGETVGVGSSGTPASRSSRRRAGRRAATPATECPVVHFNEDGSIDWIVAC